ncbi:MAG: transporter [Deltaproteobacteria bacterium HGW-Deltaproteobacteria-21]|nr:MAG: transporter [Deltaproteobacteria bacterium HGW-Deltaproteobacteria-21]
MPADTHHARITPTGNDGRCLDTAQMEKLEQSFLSWADAPLRSDTRRSRERILAIFLLIRNTGARLNEVLSLKPSDIDFKNHMVQLCKGGAKRSGPCREVEISEALSSELDKILNGPEKKSAPRGIFQVDPGHVRRKFYERAEAVGIPRELGTPDAIRRSRAVELLQNNMPIPVVQKILGHGTPNLVASYVEFSNDEMKQVARYFVDKETSRKTSARNAFFGKISRIRKGDIQSVIEILSVAGHTVVAVITNDSLSRLGLRPGAMIIAEVKAPWVTVYKSDKEPNSTAQNSFRGIVQRITRGKVASEVVVRVADGLELCSIITEESRQRIDIRENDEVWVGFNAFSVVLHVD